MTGGENIRTKLREHGERRRAALEVADRELEQVLKLAPRAIEAGVSVNELHKLGGVSRPTLYDRLGLSKR